MANGLIQRITEKWQELNPAQRWMGAGLALALGIAVAKTGEEDFQRFRAGDAELRKEVARLLGGERGRVEESLEGLVPGGRGRGHGGARSGRVSTEQACAHPFPAHRGPHPGPCAASPRGARGL